MYFGCDLSMEEYMKDFELLGYTHDEAIELSKLTVLGSPITIDPEFSKIVDVVCNFPTVNVISAEDLKKVLERSKNESN